MVGKRIKFAFRVVLLSTTALIVASAADASDLSTSITKAKQTQPTIAVPKSAIPVMSWTGFHIGIGAGLASLTAKTDVKSPINQYNSTGYNYETYDHSLADNHTTRGNRVFGSVDAGFDYQHDKFVAGVFTNFDFGSASLRHQNVDPTASTGYIGGASATNTLNTELKFGNSIDVGVRLGILATDRTLVYGLGGVSVAEIDARSSVDLVHGSGTILNDVSLVTENNGWRAGYVLGAGVEQMITDNVSFKLEYRFADYGHLKSDVQNDAGGQGTASLTQDVAVSDSSVRGVVSYRF